MDEISTILNMKTTRTIEVSESTGEPIGQFFRARAFSTLENSSRLVL